MDSAKRVKVAPDPLLPAVILLLAGPLYLVKLLAASGAAVALGLFLLLQSWRLRLVFTPDAMELENKARVVRSFPYENWRSWRLFWKGVPILLYFREVNGIHFVPMIFNGQELWDQLEQRLGRLNGAPHSADAT